MDSTIENILGILILLVLLMAGPVYDTFKTTDKLVDTIVKDTIHSFEKDTRKAGYVDIEAYNKFLKELNKTGRTYKITMTHTSKLVYPSSDTQGDYEIHEIRYGTDNILNTIKDGSSRYSMRYGDDFKILVKENEVAPSRMLLGMVANRKANLLVFTSGGMIENEVYE